MCYHIVIWWLTYTDAIGQNLLRDMQRNHLSCRSRAILRVHLFLCSFRMQKWLILHRWAWPMWQVRCLWLLQLATHDLLTYIDQCLSFFTALQFVAVLLLAASRAYDIDDSCVWVSSNFLQITTPPTVLLLWFSRTWHTWSMCQCAEDCWTDFWNFTFGLSLWSSSSEAI